ncbi:5'-3' exonuclease [Streptomyces sp. SID3343]|uniref:5'-3' exonuclease n=1 Tax=Streptomyces sp. SID3343 TaxID=2690260 RepID=UPI00136C2BB7|nr:5'-3' exonuclease [Streptomyces sp. SID3343]MYW00810.1 flap endonuclease [Streptomyces sp. SID3343]
MLLDTASLYFRAYFGVPESVKAPDGTPVNAVRGLLDFVARLVEDRSPTRLVACMDADWRPQFRVDAIASYKAHRVASEAGPDEEEIPDTLAPQVPVIEQVLDALGIARVGVAGFEADDVIATMATLSTVPVDIVTGDRDLFQLVDDKRGVRVLYTVKGVAAHEVIDEAAVLERYGVPASAYADFATLRGDASDGLPGVKGVGDKTAAQLIVEYGDLAGVRAAAADPTAKLTPARRARIVEASDYLDVAPGVVRVVREVPMAPDAWDRPLPTEPADAAALDALRRRWGLTGPVNRLLDVLAAHG